MQAVGDSIISHCLLGQFRFMSTSSLSQAQRGFQLTKLVVYVPMWTDDPRKHTAELAGKAGVLFSKTQILVPGE